MINNIPNLKDMIIDRSEIVTETGCWLWNRGCSTKHRYGIMYLQGSMRYAHRLAWIAFKGHIPSDKFVCHKCDVPSCVNPDHLFLGTHQDNMADMARKGRRRHKSCGARAGRAVLTEAQVREIRADTRGPRELARLYGVTHPTIIGIRNGRIWSSLK